MEEAHITGAVELLLQRVLLAPLWPVLPLLRRVPVPPLTGLAGLGFLPGLDLRSHHPEVRSHQDPTRMVGPESNPGGTVGPEGSSG